MTTDADLRNQPKVTLQEAEVHDMWSRQFRSGENDAFYAMAFDYIASLFGEPGDAVVLDAGCGTGTKSLELARRGFRVRALDFSESVLPKAREAAKALGVEHRIEFGREDLTALSLPSGSFRRAVCWGVLMHVPDIAAAVRELSRVMAEGGVLVVSEGNLRSLQAVSLRTLKRALGRERAETQRTKEGIEFWETTGAGRVMTRQADIPWLVAEFAKHGLQLAERRAGQFTEIYMLLGSRILRRAVHAFNNLWFRFPRLPGPAYGNLLVFRRASR